jgi:predicted urease superfamily metal-dependent hydrolase
MYLLQELCPYVSQLGTNPMAVELGTVGFFHEPLYNKLASVYNDSTHELLKLFVVNHDIYVTSGVQNEAPATFDQLSALAVSQGIDFINKHYCQARRWQQQSGNHKTFDSQNDNHEDVGENSSDSESN